MTTTTSTKNKQKPVSEYEDTNAYYRHYRTTPNGKRSTIKAQLRYLTKQLAQLEELE